jgi:uncharacterized protein YbcI
MPWREPIASELAERFCSAVKDRGGRAPTRCRVFVNDEIVTVVCEETLNATELRVQHTDVNAVARSRRAIQRMVRVNFTPQLEELLGTTVIASTSGHAVDPDVGIYNFVLAARPVQDPLREVEAEAAE